ncbi:MAG TPA: response regulator transcription factor [Candidatus Methylomirabilis sp.]|nr:response regulator transcription factor [Candidatus Methylomirabilis sp.]
MISTPPIRVLLVDDHALFRRGIASILAGERGFEVVGEAANGLEALDRARELMPDVILMDIFMPGANGLEATRRIKEALPYVKIVMLTVSEEDQNLFEAIKSGAQGYLLKKIEPQELFAMLKGVVQGDAPISRAMAGKILGEFARQARGTAVTPLPGADLSPREKEVLELVTQGRSNKEIAAALAIAENTVKNHLKNILEKLHLENRVQAATFALREGLIPKTSGKLD